MVRIKVKLGPKGQIVIPKVIRESLGMIKNKYIILEVKEKTIEIRSLPERDLTKKWGEIAKKYGGRVDKLKYGDRLYQEVF